MDKITEKIQAVINTLNIIPVSGEVNLDRMLGCIQTLRVVKTEMEKGANTDEADSEDQGRRVCCSACHIS